MAMFIMVVIMVVIVVVIVLVVVVVSWFESHTLGNKSNEYHLGQHVDGSEDFCELTCNVNTAIYTPQQVNIFEVDLG